MAEPAYLTVEDLVARIGSADVTRFFDDDGNGVADAEPLNGVMAEAEGLAAARMLRGFSAAQILTLAANDPTFVAQVAWVACELASERKSEFLRDDGKGRYWAQYERAIEHFEMLSKSVLVSPGEATAGKNKQRGGKTGPLDAQTGKPPVFIFAPSDDSPTGHGGF